MDWLTIAWSMCASASIMLGFMHLLLWFVDRRKTVYLLTSLMALSAGAGAMIELAQLHTESVETYRTLLKWQNLSVYLILIPLVVYIIDDNPSIRNYNLDQGWFLLTDMVITSNWDAPSGQQWTVPVGGGFGRVFKIGKQPINARLEGYYNVEHPDAGPDWAWGFTVQLLYPKK